MRKVEKKIYATFLKAFLKIVRSQSLHQTTNFVTKMKVAGVEAHNQRPEIKLMVAFYAVSDDKIIRKY